MLSVRGLARTRGWRLHASTSSHSSCLPSSKLFSSTSDNNTSDTKSDSSSDTHHVRDAQKEVSTSGRFYAKFVKPIEWYDSRALDRQYFYNIDLQGRLFLEETMPKNIATSLKSAKFLDFFFRQLRPNPTDGLYADEYPFISPCGKEMNYVRPFELRSPIVFYELKPTPKKTKPDAVSEGSPGAKESSHVLIYGATLQEPFDPSALVMDTTEGRLFHRLMAHNHLSPALAHARMLRKTIRKHTRTIEKNEDIQPAGAGAVQNPDTNVQTVTSDIPKANDQPLNNDIQTAEPNVQSKGDKVEHKDHLALIHSHLSISLSQSFVDCEESSAGFAFEWQGKQYPISALDDESPTSLSGSDDEDEDHGDGDGSQSLSEKSGKSENLGKSENNFIVPKSKEMFEPSHTWQPVLDYHVLPAGCEIRMDMSTREKHAKIRKPAMKYTIL